MTTAYRPTPCLDWRIPMSTTRPMTLTSITAYGVNWTMTFASAR